MTKQSLVRIILLAQLLLGHTVLSAASISDADCCKKDTAKLVLTGDAAYQWIGEHLDSLAESYIAKNGNILDPDIVRDELKAPVVCGNHDYQAGVWYILFRSSRLLLSAFLLISACVRLPYFWSSV